ncbi:hypothetical protein ACM64Y_00475 [Novispirillum sp. DQ9]|uniref:hypothetical protein n=1 Tax=Novispirillum sp. DQ9 TaxID=3398612 RepID=UPI003C7B175E
MSAPLDPRLLEAIKDVRAKPRRLRAYDFLSTSEWIALCLGVGTKAALAQLPATFPTAPEAWRRLDAGQRATVLHAWEN